jgi:hypothetical protein
MVIHMTAVIDRQPSLRNTTSMLLVAAALLLGAANGRAQSSNQNVIGGNDLVPINPDFSPPTVLYVTELNGVPQPGTTDFAQSSVAKAAGLDRDLQAQINVPVSLGAALSQAISAGNRPSVLTPYAGQLAGEGATAVFDTFGSLVTNKATTLGKGKLGIGVSAQYSLFDAFDGHDIGRSVSQKTQTQRNVSGSDPDSGLSGSTVVPLTTVVDVTAEDVEFEVDVVTLALTYGLLENIDIGALVPYIWLTTRGEVEIDVNQSATVALTSIESSQVVGTVVASSHRSYRGKFDRSYDGIGDIILFAKWQVLSQEGLPNRGIDSGVDMALQFEVKLPTGEADRFLGTEKTDVAGRMLVQRSMVEGKYVLRGEAGYNRSGLGNEFNTFDYKVGSEVLLTDSLAASVELIGSYSKEFHGILDIAGGAKYAVSRDFKVFAGVRAPLNDNGLRYDASPIVGIEYTFSPPPPTGMAGLEPARNEVRTVSAPPQRPTLTGRTGAEPGATMALAPTESKSVVIAPPPGPAGATAADAPAMTVETMSPLPGKVAGDEESLALPKGRNR